MLHSPKTAHRYVLDRIRSGTVLVALSKDNVLAVLGYLRNWSHGANYIECLNVKARQRGKGIARRLISEFAKASKNPSKSIPVC